MDFFQNEIFEDKIFKGVGCWKYAQICLKAAQKKGENREEREWWWLRGGLHRQVISCPGIFHKGPSPSGDSNFEHWVLSFSTEHLKLMVTVDSL